MPGGGAYIWKAMSIPLKIGVVDAKTAPDGASDECTMRDTSCNNLGPLKAIFDKYAQLPRTNIDYLAQIVEDYHGFVTGFSGNNTSADSAVIEVPNTVAWGHAVYVCGHRALPDGRKVLIFKNSWGDWGDNGYGYFTEEFVNSGFLFDAYVYASITDLDNFNTMILTKEDVKFLQALEGFNDPNGITYWTGKTLDQYKLARIPDKINELKGSLPAVQAVGDTPMASKLSIGDAGSLLMGVGIAKIAESVNLGLMLIGVGALLNIIVAVLQWKSIPVSSK